METLRTLKHIDNQNLERSMSDSETRFQTATLSSGRLEKIQSLLFGLKNLPEKEFESCLDACTAVVERFAQSSARKDPKKRELTGIGREGNRLLTSG
jgi:hypothetical protein